MFKQRFVKVMVSLALLAAVTGFSSTMFDSLGVSAVSVAHACENSGSQGGGC